MLITLLTSTIRRVLSFQPATRSRRVRPVHPVLELLEERWVPANIRVTDAYLIDGSQNQIKSPVVGEQLSVRVDFETDDLDFDAGYRVQFTVDGVALHSDSVDYGAGLNSGEWYYYRSGWFAESLGSHTVTVSVDSDDAVSESNEGDNSRTFKFTPVTAKLPAKFSWPEDGVPMRDRAFFNYLDLDPTAGLRDWNGGQATYDSHEGLDFGGPTNADLDHGTVVRAAAPGTVVAVEDGNFDRNGGTLDNIVPGGPPNYVRVDHGDGWVTRYLHLRRDSIAVKVGDVVERGDVLGYEGSSGHSTGSHLHFEVLHNGAYVETFLDPQSYWLNAPPYVGTARYLVDSGVTNQLPRETLIDSERPSDVAVFSTSTGVTVYAWGIYTGLRQSDQIQAVFRRPDGSVFATNSLTVPGDYSKSYWFFSRTFTTAPALGAWTVEYLANGMLLGTQSFSVTAAGAPEIRVEQADGDIVLDERFTPYDLGTASQGDSSPTQTFTVVNHGSAPLALGDINLPPGFHLIDGLPGSLAAGASDTFTVGLDTSTAGSFAGQVRIASSDNDESEYNFSIEGVVEGSNPALTLGISTRQTAEGTQVVANVRRSGNLSQSLTVKLVSSDTTTATVPATLTIPAFASTALFQIKTVPDGLTDTTRVVTITASGTGYSTAKNELDVTSGSSNPTDAPPVIGLNSLPQIYRVSSRKIVPLDGEATLTDPDTPTLDFSQAVLKVSGQAKKDQLSILKVEGITVRGKKVLYSGNGTSSQQIGTLSGGKQGNPLTIKLSSLATRPAVQSLLRAIGFKTTDKTPGTRNLQFQITNISGTNTASATKQIQITP